MTPPKDILKETGTLDIKPQSILVYTPAEKMSDREYEWTYETLRITAGKALGCDPQHLPVGIILLKPGDKLEALPSTILLKEISERLAKIEEKVGK